MKNLIYIILPLFLITVFSCKKKGMEVIEITGEKKTEVLKYADPAADNIMAGFNENDYPKYSKNFDEKMKNALTDKVFKQTRDLIIKKIGKYKSRKLKSVKKQGPYTIVLYNGRFEDESGVEIKVVFMEYADKNLVSGLWFNSPKLRK